MMSEVKDKNDPFLKAKIKTFPVICFIYKLVTEGKLGITNNSISFGNSMTILSTTTTTTPPQTLPPTISSHPFSLMTNLIKNSIMTPP